MLQRSRVFSTVLYLVRTENIKEVRLTFLQRFKKAQTSMYTSSQYGLGPWEGHLTIREGPGLESQEEGHFILHF